MCGGKQGELIEAMKTIDEAIRPGWLRGDIKEFWQFGRIEIAESLDSHTIVIPKLDSEVDLIFIFK